MIEKIKKPKRKYRECPYCGRHIPIDYNFNEHKKLCKAFNKK